MSFHDKRYLTLASFAFSAELCYAQVTAHAGLGRR